MVCYNCNGLKLGDGSWLVLQFLQRKLFQMGMVFSMRNASKIVNAVIPRYKNQLLVLHDTGSVAFVVFDCEASQFLNCSARDLRDGMWRLRSLMIFWGSNLYLS